MVLTAEPVQASSVAVLSRSTAPLDLRLRSRLPGRERWQSSTLLDCPDLARTVEMIVGSEPGVHAVTANPLTGRVLVEFDPAALARPVEVSIRSALRFRVKPPVAAARPACGTRSAVPGAVGKLLAGELICSLLKTVLFAAPSLPARAAIAAAMLLLVHRRA